MYWKGTCAYELNRSKIKYWRKLSRPVSTRYWSSSNTFRTRRNIGETSPQNLEELSNMGVEFTKDTLVNNEACDTVILYTDLHAVL